jgi:hypothetical protein
MQAPHTQSVQSQDTDRPVTPSKHCQKGMMPPLAHAHAHVLQSELHSPATRSAQSRAVTAKRPSPSCSTPATSTTCKH